MSDLFLCHVMKIIYSQRHTVDWPRRPSLFGSDRRRMPAWWHHEPPVSCLLKAVRCRQRSRKAKGAPEQITHSFEKEADQCYTLRQLNSAWSVCSRRSGLRISSRILVKAWIKSDPWTFDMERSWSLGRTNWGMASERCIVPSRVNAGPYCFSTRSWNYDTVIQFNYLYDFWCLLKLMHFFWICTKFVDTLNVILDITYWQNELVEIFLVHSFFDRSAMKQF